MASAAGAASKVAKFAGPVVVPAFAYAVYKGRDNAVSFVHKFLTGPGRNSRIIALAIVLLNWKSLPLAWTTRVFNAMISHLFFRAHHNHPPSALFHPVISKTYVSILEVDYNIHKSNSTYFADLDVSRSHLVSHLFARGIRALAHNTETKLIMDPRDPTQPAKGKFGVMLGAVACSFKREIKPYQRYEMWTRILSWDRKWLYIVTHFVETGAVRPKGWDQGKFGLTRNEGNEGKFEDWEKKIFASAVSKYVFKVGRLTVHPAVVMDASGLLPERPEGWVSTESGMGTPAEPVTGQHDDVAPEAGWDWKKTEAERLRGMEYAEHFAAVDELISQFDGGEDGALGHFGLG